MRKDYFFIGLGTRVLMLFLFILLNQKANYNDASEIIYNAFTQLLSGHNPYSQIYELHWGSSTFTQPFNYGPIMFILFLPAMLIPVWYKSLWIGMAIMINVYCYLIAEYISKKGSRDMRLQKNAKISFFEKDPRQNQMLYYGGVFFWMIPVGTTCITVFIYAPILLVILAFGELKNSFKSGLFISLAGFSYQLVLLFAPIFAIYHLKRGWKDFWRFIMGCIPALLILSVFIVWSPGGLFESLIGYNAEMPYVKCSDAHNGFDTLSYFSIPKILYSLSNGNIQIGPEMRLGLAVIFGIICLIYLFSHRFDVFEEFFIIKYCIWADIGFTLTTNFGQSHYLIFLYALLLYYYQMKKPDFRKNIPIGPGVWNWDDFEKYKKYYGKIPL
ncbi:MAG: hypothetical protein ACTSVU_08870 [Promethearchaeota archaeon]